MAGAERRGVGEPRDRGAQTKERSRAGAGHLSSVGLDGDGIERGEPGRSRRSAVEECASRRARTCCWFAPGWRYSVRSCRIWFTPSCCGCHRAGAEVPPWSRRGRRQSRRGACPRPLRRPRRRAGWGAVGVSRARSVEPWRDDVRLSRRAESVAIGGRRPGPPPRSHRRLFRESRGCEVHSARRAISHRIPIESRRPNRRFLVRVYSATRAARHHLGKAADVFLVAAEKQENGR